MGQNIFAGATLIGGQAAGDLNQYYALADTTSVTVTASSATALSSTYTIPANEPYAGAAYQLSCGGFGTWGSTQQAIEFDFPLNSTGLFTAGWADFASTALAASQPFSWHAVCDFTCQDGIQLWLGTLKVAISGNTSHANAVTLGSPAAAITSPVNVPIACLLQAKWLSTTGAPTITKTWGTFRKVA